MVQTSRERKIFCSPFVKPLRKPREKAFGATISGDSGIMLGNKDVKDGYLFSKAYASIQSTKHVERGNTERIGDLTNY